MRQIVKTSRGWHHLARPCLRAASTAACAAGGSSEAGAGRAGRSSPSRSTYLQGWRARGVSGGSKLAFAGRAQGQKGSVPRDPHSLYVCHLRGVVGAEPGAEHARVAPVPPLVPLRHLAKQLVQLVVAADDARRPPPRVQRPLQEERDQQQWRVSAQAGALRGERHARGLVPAPPPTSLPSVTTWSASRLSSLAFCTVVSIRPCFMSCETIVLRQGEQARDG